jgi:hypothetical protein
VPLNHTHPADTLPPAMRVTRPRVRAAPRGT